MAFTLANAKDLAEILLDDTTDNHWSDTQKTFLANRANRIVFERLFSQAADVFLTTSQFTWPANTGSLDISGASYLNASVRGIKAVVSTPNSGAPSTANRPTPWTALASYGELAERQVAKGPLVGPFAWFLADETMYVAPTPTAAQILTVAWYGQPTALSSASDAVLGGKCEEMGETVGLCLAYLMNTKQNNSNPGVSSLWEDAKRMLDAFRKTHAPQRTVTTRAVG